MFLMRNDSALELRCEFIPENVECYGIIWRFGNGIGQQARSGQGEKGEESLCVFHGIQFY